MSAGPRPRVRALSVHADYRCRSSGACCSSGWSIGVEPERAARLSAAVRSGVLAGLGINGQGCLANPPGLPPGAHPRLAFDAAGRCLFLEADGLCAVHRRLGEDALPSACRQFPRVSTLTPHGVSVTLSHYCPTAAGLLFSGSSLRIVEEPAAFPASWDFEGLDAREALPPLLRPGVLMTWAAHERWERYAVAVLEQLPPDAALERLTAAAEAARSWTPADGDFDAFFSACHPEGGRGSPAAGAGGGSDEGWDDGKAEATDPWTLVASTVPGGHPRPAPPPIDPSVTALVEAGWHALAGPVCAWLATKAFASWLALQGQGLRTTVRGLRVALGVLRAEATRVCLQSGSVLDAALLKEALRRADLLLVHLADPEALARRLSRCESAGMLGSTVRA